MHSNITQASYLPDSLVLNHMFMKNEYAIIAMIQKKSKSLQPVDIKSFVFMNHCTTAGLNHDIASQLIDSERFPCLTHVKLRGEKPKK